MQIPLDSVVRCADGEGGRATHVIIDPVSRQITHLVVAEEEAPATRRVVPLEAVMASGPHAVQLRWRRSELSAAEPFSEAEYLPGAGALEGYAPDRYVLWPYLTPVARLGLIVHERIAPGELAVRRGASVEARDGAVGRVDAFLVDPADGHISHLIVRDDSLWGDRQISIPLGQVERLEREAVYLTLSRAEVAALPDIPLNAAL